MGIQTVVQRHMSCTWSILVWLEWCILDLYVNDVDGDDLTIDDGDEASSSLMEVGDDIHTTWTGAWDGECAYAFYNAAGELVAESDFDLLCSFTVWPSAVDVFFSEHAEVPVIINIWRYTTTLALTMTCINFSKL